MTELQQSMTELPERLFANPIWHALQTRHSHLAVRLGEACRYPADVAPFAAVARPTEDALRELMALLVPGESVWLMEEALPAVEGLVVEGTLRCLQMVLPEAVPIPEAAVAAGIVAVPEAAAEEMVALTDAAFPGFFRRRTCAMGRYYGVRAAGELVAMAGERMALAGYTEISGVCTHPEHRGNGYAPRLMWEVARQHRHDGVISFLHVAATNTKAIALYRRMGFVEARTVMLHRLRLAG